MSLGESTKAAPPATRWLQLLFGIVCMVAIANLQYGWTLFVHPIHAKHGWSRPAIQVAFTILILAETWLVPIEGWFVDRFGPRITVLFGGVFVAAGWITNSVADTLLLLYIGAALGGIGAGCVFGTCIGNVVRWFPDRRGLATGLTAAGYGMGSVFTLIPRSKATCLGIMSRTKRARTSRSRSVRVSIRRLGSWRASIVRGLRKIGR